MDAISQRFYTKPLRMICTILMVGYGSFFSGALVQANQSVTVIDTLAGADITTQFSLLGSSSHSISLAGPEFTLTQPTILTEIGGFFINCGKIIAGELQCPTILPLTVQIVPATNGLPDSNNVLASFRLSYDNDPFFYSYTSVATNLTLPAGTYFALFNGNSQGAIMAQATSPYYYKAKSVPWAYVDPATGNFIVSSGEYAAVRILGTLTNGTISKAVLKVNSLLIDQKHRNLFMISTFALGVDSNGINPTKETITLKVDTIKKTLPAGSFKKNRHGQFTFIGQIGNVWIKALIKPLGSNRFRFQLAESDANLNGIKNPVTVNLTIGDDIGVTSVKAHIKNNHDSHGKYEDY